MKIETLTHVPVGTLKPYARNPRTHTKKQIKQIAASINEFGFTNPILVDANGGIIAGHGRLEAAKILGFETVPTICLDHMSESQKRAYIIADNRLAELAGWDDAILALEFQGLLELDIDFDVELTGFETAEIDLLIGEAAIDESDPADIVPEADESAQSVTQTGDLWLLGRHKLYCGDATVGGSYDQLMEGSAARAVFADVPYNVPISGHVSGLGAVKHREFAMASGEMSEAEFTAFLKTTLGHMATHSISGAIQFICIDWRHLFEVMSAARALGLEHKNTCVWVKTNGGMGSFYRSQHEFIAVFKAGKGPHVNNIELGRFGRYRTNVWSYAGANSFGKGRADDLAMHPTVKPTAMVADAILDCSKRGDIVLDPFVGSGTTIMAAERTGRRCFAMEMDPLYVDIAIRRWQEFTGESAVHGDTFSSFKEMKTQRA